MSGEKAEAIQTPKAHVAVNVRSVGRSAEFYRLMLGIEPSKLRPKYAKFDPAIPPLNLTLNERPFTDRGALFHLGIQVASTADVSATRDRWRAAGLATRDEPQIVCGYALQDKSWVADPDGNQWEVFVVHQDNLPAYYGEDGADSCGDHAASSCAAGAGQTSCRGADAPAAVTR